MDIEQSICHFKYFSFYDGGGAHGLYAERLLTFDHVHQQTIDWNFLFKPDCREAVLNLLYEQAYHHPKFVEWEYPSSLEEVKEKLSGDEGGNDDIPQPGLSERGVVFSFQPYDISCFAAGTFHFTIPYVKLMPYLTARAKWCLNME